MSWQAHLKQYREKHPNKSLKECMIEASQTYKRKQKGGFAVAALPAIVSGAKKVREWLRPDKTKLPLPVLQILDKHGDAIIEKFIVCRDPIDHNIDKALQWISLGKWNQMKKKLDYDELFHLFAYIKTDKGWFLTQKNARVELKRVSGEGKAKDKKEMTVDKKVTLSDLFAQAIAKVGMERIVVYDGWKWNCQQFLVDLFGSSGILDSETKAFIRQDIEQIAQNTPEYVKRFGRLVTDIGAKVDKALAGGKKLRRI